MVASETTWMCPCPGGTTDNSPAFQRWVCKARGISPEETVEGAILKHPSEMLTTES